MIHDPDEVAGALIDAFPFFPAEEAEFLGEIQNVDKAPTVLDGPQPEQHPAWEG